MKEIRAIGLIPFHQSIIPLHIQRFLHLWSKTPSDALFNLSLMSFNFPIIFHGGKKDEKRVIGNACNHVTLPLYHCLLPG